MDPMGNDTPFSDGSWRKGFFHKISRFNCLKNMLDGCLTFWSPQKDLKTFHRVKHGDIWYIPRWCFQMFFFYYFCPFFPGEMIQFDGCIFFIWVVQPTTRYILFRSTPLPVTVTTRIITFLVGDPYKPSFATVTGRGVDPTYYSVWILKMTQQAGFWPGEWLLIVDDWKLKIVSFILCQVMSLESPWEPMQAIY